MLKRSRLVALLVSTVLFMALGGVAYAHDVPDLEQTGAIKITMELDGAPVGGGVVALYRVGSIQESDGDYSFVLSDGFEGAGVALDNIQSADVAQTLATYVTDNSLYPMLTRRVGSNGTAAFINLQCGLYLVVQTYSAAGYSPANPFLVAVPTAIEGTYYYTVDASPKIEIEKAPATTPSTPTTPSGSTSTPMPKTGDDTPQVLLLVVVGAGTAALACVFAVWARGRRAE